MFYVYGFYLPVTLVVLLSWISFWIDPESTPARVSLGVITILAMGNYLHGGGATPNVSYATALDVYVITSFVFVFASLMEYAAVHCALVKYQESDLNEVLIFVFRTGGEILLHKQRRQELHFFSPPFYAVMANICICAGSLFIFLLNVKSTMTGRIMRAL